MGSFYTNVTVRGVGGEEVADWLAAQGRTAFLTSNDRDVVVFDAAGEDQSGAHVDLAVELTEALGGVALAVLNHDDDILLLHVVDRGEVLGEYNSDPGYFDDDADFDPEADLDDAPVGAWTGTCDAAGLASRFGAEPDAVAAALSIGADFASEQHRAVVAALGLPAAAVGYGHRYLDQGDRPDVVLRLITP